MTTTITLDWLVLSPLIWVGVLWLIAQKPKRNEHE